MKIHIKIIPLLLAILISSCNQKTHFVCECSYENEKLGIKENSSDTIKIENIEEAELACSNQATTDDPDELINCQLLEK